MSSAIPSQRDPDHPLAKAFASFTEAAGSLERTYGQLQSQVAQLRHELEVTNRNLARSLAENSRIRERLRRILEGLPCGVIVTENGKRISSLNPEAVRILGGTMESMDALPHVISNALMQASQDNENDSEERELPLVTEADSPAAGCAQSRDFGGAGKPAWIAIRHALLEKNENDATSVFILRDISEAKKLEQERERLRHQQALIEVSAILAHEIRNPLGSLELFAGLLAEANLEGENRRWIEHVQAGLRTLSATVNNVLHLHNTPQPELAPMDVGELLDWAYDFLLPLARQAQVQMQVINPLHGVEIRADRHRLEQVLLNLALNAFRAMPGGGWLEIRGALASAEHGNPNDLAGNAGHVEILICDTGPGISPEHRSHIFETGFSTRSGSTGLGLAVCRQILEQHDGAISAENQAGHGATFQLRIPRRVAAAALTQIMAEAITSGTTAPGCL